MLIFDPSTSGWKLVHRITDPPSGMVGNSIGSERCLSSCTHTCQPSDVPAVHLPEHHLHVPVSVPSLWPLHGTPCFHPNHQGVSGSPTSTTCMPLHLFGRLAYCRPLSGSHPPDLIKDYSADAGVGLHYQCREVFPHSISKPNVSGSLPRSLYSPGRVCPSVPLGLPSSSSEGCHYQAGPGKRHYPVSSQMVDFTSEPSVRYAVPTTLSISHSNHRRIGVWLGCSPRWPPGAPGCSQGPSVLTQKSCELSYTGQIRQLDSSVVPEPSRGALTLLPCAC